MFFETELSDKLNNELESAGISVSEALIAKTLAAVQAARETEAGEENIDKLIELADVRRRKIAGAGPVLFRVATVAAACFVLVVGGFALRFSAMRMGKETAPMTPMMTAENGSVRSGIHYAADADSVATGEEYSVYAAPAEDCLDVAVAEEECTAEVPEAFVPTAESDASCAATELISELEQAASVEKEQTVQGMVAYRFIMQDNSSYLVHENGEAEKVIVTAGGESVTAVCQDEPERSKFRREVLVWMKQNGYEF